MSGQKYSVIAVRGGEQRLILVTDDVLQAFDLVSKMTLVRKMESNEVSEHRILDGSGRVIGQSATRLL